MKTYQDLVAASQSEESKQKFINDAITEHITSEMYRTAEIAELYANGKNALISEYQKFLYTISGDKVPDNFTANHKMKSGLFKRYVNQITAYLLGNGVNCQKKPTNHDKLGDDFDKNLFLYGRETKIQAVVFGFWNIDHVDWFKLTEFVPLWDEKTGKLAAGIRFWQIEPKKPMRITLFELDGFTEYVKDGKGNMAILEKKRDYKLIGAETEAMGNEIKAGENYDQLPIVPFWGNANKQSSLVGVKEQIDCYDLIKSGFANDLDDASMLYWTLTNYGGMDDIDLVKFVERMKTIRAAVVEGEGASAEAHTIDVPYQSREAYLAILKKDFIEDTQMLDVEQIQAGNVTATQIEAAYEPLNEITDEFEFLAYDFCQEIFKLAGIDDVPVFKRSQMKNMMEETQMILLAANYLDEETLLAKLPFLTNDEIEIIKKKKAAEDTKRFIDTEPDDGTEGEEGEE